MFPHFKVRHFACPPYNHKKRFCGVEQCLLLILLLLTENIIICTATGHLFGINTQRSFKTFKQTPNAVVFLVWDYLDRDIYSCCWTYQNDEKPRCLTEYSRKRPSFMRDSISHTVRAILQGSPSLRQKMNW